ncbi:MAG: hypothetical protein IJE25_05825 [Clostridia bacterium]|nr:hypothetical protein [Clostridia bacterium]
MKKIIGWIKKIFHNMYFWIVVGFIATLSYALTLLFDHNSPFNVIFNILAMLGSGIFCSAIVSLGFEKATKRRLVEEQNMQREFYFSYLIHYLECIILEELTFLCELLGVKYNDKNGLDDGISVDVAMLKLNEMYNKLKDDKLLVVKASENVDILSDYEDLEKAITPLLKENIQFVLSNVISIEGINCLSKLARYRESIVRNHKNKNNESLIVLKLGFFDSIQSLLKIVEPRYDSIILNFTFTDET